MHDKKRIPLLIFALIFLYLGKLYFFPSEFETARAHLAGLSKLASFENVLAPLQMMNRLQSLKTAIAPDLLVDTSEYNFGQKSYAFKDFEALAPMYFKSLQHIEVLTRDFKRVTGRQYQVVVIGRGATAEKSFDDAYMLLITFDQEWKLAQVKVLPPPKQL